MTKKILWGCTQRGRRVNKSDGGDQNLVTFIFPFRVKSTAHTLCDQTFDSPKILPQILAVATLSKYPSRLSQVEGSWEAASEKMARE